MAENEEIKVKDLPDVQSVQTSNEIMVLTDAVNNAVSNITIEDFETSIISADADNNLTLGADNKFYTKSYDADIANLQDLSALDADGKALINNSKALETGAVSNNADIYADIYQYAHSTYDSTKFTVTGTPLITADGIVSNISNLNYVHVDNAIDLHADSFEVGVSFNAVNFSAIQRPLQYYNGLILQVGTDGKIGLYVSSTGDGTYDIASNVKSTNALTLNNTYKIQVVFTGSQYVVYVDGVAWITVDSTTKVANQTNLYVFSGKGSQPSAGSQDLKTVYVKINGYIAFTGTQTGLDTIKAADYSVTGTPTITADGIASGLSSSNYLSSPSIDLSTAETWKIRIKTDYIPQGTSAKFLIGNNSASAQKILLGRLNTTGNLYFRAFAADETQIASVYTNMGAHFTGYVEFGFTGSQYFITRTLSDGTTNTSTADSTTKTGQNGALYIGYDFNSTIDLNSIEVYINDELVYQPCLLIPYTLSKTGSKVVDVYARNRVQSMYEQYGYAPYYTIDEINQTYTLPMGEIYGLTLNQSTPHIVTHYKNGVDYVDTYSNGVVEQGGTCTSGTAVVFTKAYADTNYVLTIPYSAKSATGFTPSATGDWIAKG